MSLWCAFLCYGSTKAPICVHYILLWTDATCFLQGPGNTPIFLWGMKHTYVNNIYVSLRVQRRLRGPFVVDEPNSAYRRFSMTASRTPQSRFAPFQLRLVTYLSWASNRKRNCEHMKQQTTHICIKWSGLQLLCFQPVLKRMFSKISWNTHLLKYIWSCFQGL